MAAFSYHQPPFLVDSVFLPNSPLKSCGVLDESTPQNLNQFHPSGLCSGLSFDASAHKSLSCVDQNINDTPMKEKQSSQSLSMADNAESGDQMTQNRVPLDKKRKSRNGYSSNSANSKDIKQGSKCKKQKGDKESKNDMEAKKDRIVKKDQKKDAEEPPTGYIHVRARRGQATDSHSLAERVRREKISERMKMLQALVPGCDKVTGKALMLDKIINYVQSLQNQVEFLSMKLASLDPMVYNFGLMDLEPISTEDNGSLYWGAKDPQQQSVINQFCFGANNLYSLQ